MSPKTNLTQDELSRLETELMYRVATARAYYRSVKARTEANLACLESARLDREATRAYHDALRDFNEFILKKLTCWESNSSPRLPD